MTWNLFLFTYVFNFFQQCFVVFIVQDFHLLGEFFFILFNTIVNGLAFVISFSDCSLLAYRNEIDYNILYNKAIFWTVIKIILKFPYIHLHLCSGVLTFIREID